MSGGHDEHIRLVRDRRGEAAIGGVNDGKQVGQRISLDGMRGLQSDRREKNGGRSVGEDVGQNRNAKEDRGKNGYRTVRRRL